MLFLVFSEPYYFWEKKVFSFPFPGVSKKMSITNVSVLAVLCTKSMLVANACFDEPY